MTAPIAQIMLDRQRIGAAGIEALLDHRQSVENAASQLSGYNVDLRAAAHSKLDLAAVAGNIGDLLATTRAHELHTQLRSERGQLG